MSKELLCLSKESTERTRVKSVKRSKEAREDSTKTGKLLERKERKLLLLLLKKEGERETEKSEHEHTCFRI